MLSTIIPISDPMPGTWLQEYSLGELWKKNIFGGRPTHLPGEYYGIVPVTRNHIKEDLHNET